MLPAPAKGGQPSEQKPLSFLNLLCLPAGQHQAKHDEGGACLKLSVVSTHGNALGYSLKYPNANELSLILSPTVQEGFIFQQPCLGFASSRPDLYLGVCFEGLEILDTFIFSAPFIWLQLSLCLALPLECSLGTQQKLHEGSEVVPPHTLATVLLCEPPWPGCSVIPLRRPCKERIVELFHS